MPQLKNPKQEALAQGLALGKPQMAAYTEAGYTGRNSSAATKACNHPDVQVRKAELIRDRHEIERQSTLKAIEDTAVDKAYIITRAKYVVDRSIRGTKPVRDEKGAIISWLPSHGDNSAAINGLKLLAQIGGHLVERHEFGGPGDFARLSQEDLEREMVLVGEAIGIPADQIQKAIAGRSE